ncbi:DNA recombination protein RmuC [Colwellia sp. E2M01]|uniref:DNA recombination protein RmuC n=1 Tax=Colwellia sp. E2M01 TaxID=2841561 RepID=UPI001C0A126A|nr:DNA recombination protein RmuC [Colwellia sp. E2M01]MBU2871932.1 DNA recombination protein RmuC [Colwellia sp. E2M01]
MNFPIDINIAPQHTLPLALTLVLIFFIIMMWLLYQIAQIKKAMLSPNLEQEERIKSLLTQTLNQELAQQFSNHFANQLSSLQQSYQQTNQQQLAQAHDKQQIQLANTIDQQMADLRLKLMRQMNDLQTQLTNQQSQSLDQVINHLNNTGQANREELAKTLAQTSEQMSKRIDGLTQATDNRLQEISGQVEKRLAEGFEKTTKTFSDILQRLALIDDAQKKITELSTNVVSLQEVLNDKRSRGAFGEVQLNSLIRNVLPEQSFKLQHTLSNGKIADCVLFLPKPTGNVVVDSKFPLESYRKMVDLEAHETDRTIAMRQFKVDIKKHINDISEKYLIDNETADGAIMFIPAEAIFAEIHGHQSDLVEYANQKRVWLTSPTTLMAILTTARSVLKDEATRQQIHIIQAHLSDLGKDFNRFKTRFANLAKHIDQAASDVKQIHTSADKISTRFEKIEQVELAKEEVELLEK